MMGNLLNNFKVVIGVVGVGEKPHLADIKDAARKLDSVNFPVVANFIAFKNFSASAVINTGAEFGVGVFNNVAIAFLSFIEDALF